MKNTMWKMFTLNNSTVYYNKLDDLVNEYNNKKHPSRKMTPRQASNENNRRNCIF